MEKIIMAVYARKETLPRASVVGLRAENSILDCSTALRQISTPLMVVTRGSKICRPGSVRPVWKKERFSTKFGLLVKWRFFNNHYVSPNFAWRWVGLNT